MNLFIPDFVVNPKISTTKSRKRANQLQSLNFHLMHTVLQNEHNPEKRKKNTHRRSSKNANFQELEILRNELHFEELQAEARRLDEMRPSGFDKFFKKETKENTVQVKKKKPKKKMCWICFPRSVASLFLFDVWVATSSNIGYWKWTCVLVTILVTFRTHGTPQKCLNKGVFGAFQRGIMFQVPCIESAQLSQDA